MNNRRKLIVALGVGVLGTPLGSFAQQQAKVWRIGFLGSENAAERARETDAFRGGLKDLGYVEGRNIVIEYRWAEGAYERLPQLAAELLREKVDVLVTHAQGVRAAHRATTTVPIVIATLGIDPVSAGFAKSLARPGGNITGSLSLTGLLTVKQLELVKDTLPSARKVAFMVLPTDAGGEMVKGMEVAAKTLKLDLQLVQVSGGLMGYGANILNNYRRAAYFIDRIFKGAKPADLPIEQPTMIELVVNLKTAKALGIKIPDIVMARADRMIN